ncbi:MAG: sodium/proton antiporter NhaB [Alphaproteobacteria bacterium]
MATSVANAFVKNFLGNSPDWYKMTIIGFLLINPVILFTLGPVTTGWVLVIEFIFTLAMALKCYPLQPGGLLAIEAVALGMTSPGMVYHEIEAALPVILLLMFMVAGIFFMKDLLLFIFTKILIRVQNKILLSLMFSLVGAVLSAFLDALTVTAVVIAIGVGFYSIFHRVASGKQFHHDHDHQDDNQVHELHRTDLEEFRAFLRSLMMHAAVGTALGGVCTLVGEPQNIIIGERASWDFIEFFFRMAPISMPVLVAGLMTVVLLEVIKIVGYGAKMPETVRDILVDYDAVQTEQRTAADVSKLIAQSVVGLWLVVGLLLHLAEVGLIGLSVIVLATTFTGITEEHQIGKAFEEALPFTALLVVFFAIVAVIGDQGLFTPVITEVLKMEGTDQLVAFYLANGVLSAISDNVFVATVYINQITEALRDGIITRDQFDVLAVAINTGTNIPSVATPNGQAAFLFLLTSALAPLIRLSYMRMVVMALPYTIIMTLTGLVAAYYLLGPVTEYMYDANLITHHSELPGQESSGGH